MDTQPTNTRESVAAARVDETKWSGFSIPERVRHIELEGYAVIPDLLTADQVKQIGDELDALSTTAVDYSPHQRGHNKVHLTDSPHAIAVVVLPAMLETLNHLFGDDLICTAVDYACSEPGHPGIAIHTDAQPYGSQIFGLQASSPCLVRVLYYLDDLTRERSPFKVIPRSHLSMHKDAIPYERYLSHEDELMVRCRAGSAVIINQRVFHGNYPNYSENNRRMLAIAYRPAWAGPIGEVPDWDAEALDRLPDNVRSLFGSLNTRQVNFDVPNRPEGMSRSAHGLSPARWGQVGK